ncbi:EH signature domain-containing protein [Microseira wollei]|uniref:Zorya protein ZorC EH domain-containing protein n=1 Tax=Microseira wollei NIES-4236 TaxID=2530354 RepID=A0AAV3XEH7_9CYAN|nr:EH signature domain-containing protein [Microseira wollei]GET39868.1 hypothetical protein MiSe_46400 [Microseira wollei NIES-4236]
MFRQLKVPQNPPEWEPKKLKVARDKISRESVKAPNIPKTETSPPRAINDIIYYIQNEQTEQLTQLDWVYCLYAKTQWDIQNPEKSRETSQAIWQVAKTNEWLKRRLFWRIALHYSEESKVKENSTVSTPSSFRLYTSYKPNSASGEKPSAYSLCPPSLVEGFSEFANNSTGTDRLPIQIIKALNQDQSAYNLAKLSWQYLRTPPDFLEYAGLPRWLKEGRTALDFVAEMFAKKQVSGNPEVEWLLRCLKQMSPLQQMLAVEELLTKISGEMVTRLPKLIEWLQEQYSQSDNNGKWHQLSDGGKAALSRWIGTVNYGYFQQLVDLLARMLKLPDEEQRKLAEKRDFWANYSDRIQRIRLLLPQSSVTALGYQLQINVDILAEDGSDPTEICIFDFGNYYIIEFLRGSGSEARLIPRNPKMELLLFCPTKLSVKKLRSLGGETHDRIFQWQAHCQRWLSQKNIRPNAGTEYFKGLLKHQGKYDPNKGLPLPDAKEQKEREALLKQWQRQMEKLEREAKS